MRGCVKHPLTCRTAPPPTVKSTSPVLLKLWVSSVARKKAELRGEGGVMEDVRCCTTFSWAWGRRRCWAWGRRRCWAWGQSDKQPRLAHLFLGPRLRTGPGHPVLFLAPPQIAECCSQDVLQCRGIGAVGAVHDVAVRIIALQQQTHLRRGTMHAQRQRVRCYKHHPVRLGSTWSAPSSPPPPTFSISSPAECTVRR